LWGSERGKTVASLNLMKIIEPKDKSPKPAFAQTVQTDKHERIARQSLHDMVVFHDTLVAEITTLKTEEAQGIAIDCEMLDKMIFVREKYEYAMNGFRELDINSERNALIALGDAMLDLMRLLHKRKDN
jgi:hypothetical protein